MCWAYTAHSSSRERRILYFVPFSLTTKPTSAAMRRRLELLPAPLVFIWKQQRRGDRPNKRTNGDFEERSYYATKGKPRGAAQQANAPLPCCARVFRAIVHSSATTVCQPTAWQHQAAACSVCTYIRTNGRTESLRWTFTCSVSRRWSSFTVLLLFYYYNFRVPLQAIGRWL